MDFTIPAAISQDLDRLRDFIRTQLVPDLPSWTQKQKILHRFFHLMGEGGWYGFKIKGGRLIRGSELREAMIIAEELAKASPGVTIVALAHVDLELMKNQNSSFF
jgi:alkylation response protein AidB-like acyl-CoA dehydrogenase